MSKDTVIFTEDEREALCLEDECEEHGDGNLACPIPRTKEEAQADLREGQQTAERGFESVKPKTATASVVRSDE